MNVTLKIHRFNPEADAAPCWGEYAVNVEPTDRVLDALLEVKARHDGTLTGWRHAFEGANVTAIAPNYYKVSVPVNGTATVTTTVSACELPRCMDLVVPKPIFIIIAILLLLLLLFALMRKLRTP